MNSPRKSDPLWRYNSPWGLQATSGPDVSNTGLRMGELLSAFAFASDLAFGLELEDCLRSCYLGVRIAEQMGLPPDELEAVYYTALLKDAGCTCWTSVMAEFLRTDEIAARREAVIFADGSLPSFARFLRHHVAPGQPLARRVNALFDVFMRFNQVMQEGWITACEVSARIAGRLAMPRLVQEAMLCLFEHWDGKGNPHRLAGEAIPIVSRVVLPSFLLIPFHRLGGREGASRLARAQRGKAFDPAVVDAFEALARRDDFWRDLEDAPILDLVVEMEPRGAVQIITEERFDDVAYAFADFIDLKSPYTAAHSRRSAAIAERIAALMRLGDADRRSVKRTALIHDLGLVAVPSFYLNQPESRLSQSEREMIRLHPYHGERILERARAMSAFASAVGAHHERFDGSGFFRGLRGKDIPLAARITAVADRLDELTHERPDHPAMEVEQALKALISESATAFDPDIVFSVAGGLGSTDITRPPPQWPAGLTDREVEVLRLAAKGFKRSEIGRALGISENTARHHLEHIYAKTGTSTRVSAALFAIEHDLVE